MNYIEFEFEITDAAQTEQLVALLSEEKFDGFEELPKVLKAFVKEEDFDEDKFKHIVNLFAGLDFVQSTIENKNWNAQWESSFDPVLVGDFAAIRAAFHEPIPEVKYEIVITPKMSFGTGHHATTYLMISQMEQLNFLDNTVIDFGTGTGVLAILAEKLGAGEIEALDNDEWSIDNAKENIATNHCHKIHLYKAETIDPAKKTDIILANINLNVITANLDAIIQVCSAYTEILFSGLLISDKPVISKVLIDKGFELVETFEKDNWLCIKAIFRSN